MPRNKNAARAERRAAARAAAAQQPVEPVAAVATEEPAAPVETIAPVLDAAPVVEAAPVAEIVEPEQEAAQFVGPPAPPVEERPEPVHMVYTMSEPPARKYGRETEEADIENETLGLRGINVAAMNETQLRAFAMQNFGRRYQEGESRAYMARDVMNRMDVGFRSRNA